MNKTATKTPTTFRPLNEIANEIRRVWRPAYFGAVPYIDAMQCLTDKTSRYGMDSASSIVNYFLANAQTWKGEDARRIKLELKAAIK